MAGSFDKNKDYAAAIKNETDPGKKSQLIQERQNKIDYLNSTGTNKWGATNSIYGSKYSTISEKGGSSGGGSSWGSSSGPDYAAIAAEAKRQADAATNLATLNAAQVQTQNAAMESAMKNTNDTYSGFNKATVDNTWENGGINRAAALGYFDPNRDYAADIAKETDPDKKAQLMQERQFKLDWMNANGTNSAGYTNAVYGGTQNSGTSGYSPYYQDYTQGWSLDTLGKGAREDLNNRVYDIINAMRQNSAAYAYAPNKEQLAAENQAYAEQLNKLGVSVRQFQPGGSWYYTGRPVLQGDPYETETWYYKLYDVPEEYDMFINNNNYESLLYDKDPKTEAEYGGDWGDWFMNAADMQAGAVDAQLKALQAQLELQKGENNSYYDDIAAQAYVAKRQAEAAMPQRLAAYGISGGGSETAQLGLDTSYQNNLNANELARQNMLQQLDYQNILAQSQANSDKANIYAQAQKDAFNAYLQQQQMQQQQEQWQWQKDTWLQEFNWQRQQYENQMKNQMDQDEWTRRQYEIDLALELGDYNKLADMGYNVDYLQQLQNYELQQLAQQAMKSSSSSSKSSGSSGSSGYYSSGSSTPVVNSVSAGPQPLSSGSSTPQTNGYTFLVMNYKALGDGPAFEEKVADLIQKGQVSREDYEAFLRNYGK